MLQNRGHGQIGWPDELVVLTTLSTPISVWSKLVLTSNPLPMSSPTDLLCCDFPSKLGICLNYPRALRFDDKPDYSYLRKLFRDMFVRESYQYDYVFDWRVQMTQEDGGSGKATHGRRKVVQEEDEHPQSDRT